MIFFKLSVYPFNFNKHITLSSADATKCVRHGECAALVPETYKRASAPVYVSSLSPVTQRGTPITRFWTVITTLTFTPMNSKFQENILCHSLWRTSPQRLNKDCLEPVKDCQNMPGVPSMRSLHYYLYCNETNWGYIDVYL